MHLRGYGLLSLIAMLLCSADCGVPYMIYSAVTPPRVVPPPSQAWRNEYILKGIYRLKQPLFLVNRPKSIVGDFPQYTVVPPGDTYSGMNVPASVDAYEASQPGTWPRVLGVLPEGTLLRLEEIRYVQEHTWVNPIIPGFDTPFPRPLFTILNVNAAPIGPVDGSGIPGSQFNPNIEYLEHSPGPHTLP
jgi:hypothetical protein